MQPRTLAIIQARMSASRLPGKVLLDIAGEPMLVRVVERTRRAKTIHEVVVATTADASDDPIAAMCAQRGYRFYRGSQHDVLDRYYQAARKFGAEVIVRITADCPLMDPDVVDETVEAFMGREGAGDQGSGTSDPGLAIEDNQPLIPFDFAANRLPPPWQRTYPIGLDVEVCTFQAITRAWKEADQPHQREHVMPYLYEMVRARHFTSLQEAKDVPPGYFRVRLVNHDPDYGHHRWTVDTPEDLELVRRIYARFPGRDDFSWLEVLALFESQPELAQINAQVQHKDYREVDRRREK